MRYSSSTRFLVHWQSARSVLVICAAFACSCSGKSDSGAANPGQGGALAAAGAANTAAGSPSTGGSGSAGNGAGAQSASAGAEAGGASNSAGAMNLGGALNLAGATNAGATGGAVAAGGAAPIPSDPSSVTITSRFPASAASACADAPLRLSFSAAVTVGAQGKIQVFKTSAPTIPIDVIDVATPAATPVRDTIAGRGFFKVRPVFIEGTDAVIYFKTKAMAAPGSYFVTIDSGVFVDAGQKPLLGIAGPMGFQFNTVAPAPADPTKLTVARDGTGDFCTVQGAVDFVPAANMTATTITIKKATYHEIVFISAKHNLTFHGEDRKQTIIAYPNNDTLQAKLGTAYRAMVEAEGSNGLVFENLTLHNTTPQGGSQAEALRIEPGDQAILRDSDFLSLQDTLLLTGRVYVSNSYVEGNVDYIWGKGTAYFEKSEIKTVGRAGYLVQSRNLTNFGYVFVDSTLSTDGTAPGATVLARIEGDRFPNSSVAYVNCKMGPQIAPKGWLITNSTGMPVAGLDLTKLKFWEYQSTNLAGEPLDVSMRDPASKQITETEATMLRDKASVLAGWNPTP